MSSTKTANGSFWPSPLGTPKPPRPLRLRVRHREEVKRWKKKYPERVKALGRINYARNKAKFRAKARRNYRKYPEIRLRADLKKRYNLDLEAYKTLLTAQNGLCAICGQAETGKFSRLSVDHDHATGRVRGLLCAACNSGLGRLKDSEELLIRALEYLRNAHLAPKS